ncbi:MAG: hypothetical protein AAF160_13850 [Pseudomonadota bacterium]
MFDQAMTGVQTPTAEPRKLADRIDPARLKRLKDREYRTMYWLIVPICLVVALVGRIARALGFGRDAYHSSYQVARGSLTAEASRMAHTVIPFAFWR